MLFTHRGLSGPAILQISSYWKKPEAIRIDWSPEQQLLAPLRADRARRDLAAAKAALRAQLPARLADRLVEAASPQSWTNHALDELEQPAAFLDVRAQRHGRLREGGSDSGRSEHERAFSANHGVPQRTRTLLYWRGGRRDRPTGRIQLPVGLGVGSSGRTRSLAIRPHEFVIVLRSVRAWTPALQLVGRPALLLRSHFNFFERLAPRLRNPCRRRR